MRGFGPVTRVGVEGTGAYGAGLARFLRRAGVEVIEVDRPNRQVRRAQGKSDPADAVEAAKRSARETRIKALNQIRHLSFTAPRRVARTLPRRSA
jgi:transposase